MKIIKRLTNNAVFLNSFWIIIGRVFQVGLTFVTTMLVTRYLGPQKYGSLTYVYSYIQFFIPLCALGLNDIAFKELSENRDTEIVGTMIILRLVFSLLSIIASVCLVSLFNNNSEFVKIAILQSFSLFFQSFESIMYFYQSKQLSKKIGIIYIIAYTITAALRIVFIFTNKNIFYFAVAMSLDFAMVAVLLLYVYYRDGNNIRFSLKEAKRLLGKSRYYIFAGLMIVLYGKVTDTFLLGKMIDETTVGYYTAATSLCNAWPFVLTAIIDSSSPVIIDLYDKDRIMFKKRLKQLYATVFYIGLIVAVLINILSDLIITILYGTDYMPASIPLKIASWSTIFAYIGVARAIWIQCENKARYERLISLFGAAVNIMLNYTLIKLIGINGAAIALTLTQFLTNFIFLFFIDDLRENGELIWDAIMLKDVFR